MNAEQWRKQRADAQADAEAKEIAMQMVEVDRFLLSNKTFFEPREFCRLHPKLLLDLEKRGFKITPQLAQNGESYDYTFE